MGSTAKILVVDDDSFMHEIIAETLGNSYQIIPAENGNDALAKAQSDHPGLIILDVEMPGMDGYEICRKLKEIDATAKIPVIFDSAHDQIENRLKGYEAGGEDYIIKPFAPQELDAKVAHMLKAISERAGLKQMADYATSTAMTAMSSMGEMGALLEALKSFNACDNYRTLADAALAGLAAYGMQGAIQIRTGEIKLTRNSQGEASPLETSVISHMANMDRITQFKTSMSITYPHISLLVNNMPVSDPDRCGRLRDHLAMLVEGADVRVQGISDAFESTRRGEAIQRAVAHITTALNEIDSAQRKSLMDQRVAFSNLTDEMENALTSVALTESQEEYLSSIIRNGIENIINVQSAELDMQNKLTSIVGELKTMLNVPKNS
jgi:CheY-like chemotaxis protein